MCSLCLEFFSRHVWLDEETGFLHRTKNGRRADVSNGKYRGVQIYGNTTYQAHRVVFLLANGRWPKHTVDHRDRNGHNNHPKNLRDATMREQWLNSDRADAFRRRDPWRYGANTAP